MSGYTAGHGLDATVCCALFRVGKKNSPFCFSHQTVERIVKEKRLSDSFGTATVLSMAVTLLA